MTTPADPQYAQRLKVAGQAVGTENPQLAHLLATSGLSSTEIQAVGGFTNALNLNTAHQLATDAGVPTNFTDAEQNSLAAIGTQVNQPSLAERAAAVAGNAQADGGNIIFHNPVTHGILTGFDWLLNLAKMPFRMVSSAISEDTQARDAEMKAMGYDPTSTVSKLAFMFNHGESEYHNLDHARQMFGDDLVDLAVQQQADPEQFQKDLLNMDPSRAAQINTTLNSAKFKDAYAAVDAMHISPGRDLANLVLSPFGVHTENNGLFKFISGAADAAYTWFADPTLILGKVMTAARAADVLGRVSDEMSFTQKLMTRAAGSDGVLGKLVGRRAGGIQNTVDQQGIYKLAGFDPVTGEKIADTPYSQAFQQFLDRAARMRALTKVVDDAGASAEEKAAALTQRAQLYTIMDRTQGVFMPLLPEIHGTRVLAPATTRFNAGLVDDEGNLAEQAAKTEPQAVDATVTSRTSGGWEATQGKPITDVKDFVDYLVSTNGLTRLVNGAPAQQLMVMPGRVSWWAERMAARKADKAEKWFKYTPDAWAKTMPVDAEAPSLAMLDAAGMDDNIRKQLGNVQYNLLRTGTPDGQGFNYFTRARTRMERMNRRISTVLPQTREWDLTDGATTKDVERFARFYLNKGDARMLAAAYANGDLAARRAVIRGMHLQAFHASGISRSAAGQQFMDKFVGDLDTVDRQMYGLGDTDLVPSDRGMIHAALSNAQLSTTVPMPSVKEMNRLALRFLADGWYTTRGMSAGLGALQSNRVDALYGHIKMGWITSVAGGLRNAMDELVGFMAKGMFSQWVRGRQLWTQATQEARANRIDYSLQYRDLTAQYGQYGARDHVAGLSGQASQDLEQAQRAHEAALRAQEERDTLESRLHDRYDRANEAYQYHQNAHFDAVTELNAAKRSSAPADVNRLDELQARVDETAANVDQASKARGKAKMAITKLPEVRAHLEAQIASRGTLDVDEAKAQLADAEAAVEQARGLENAIHHRIPYFLRRFGDSVNDVLFGATASKLLRVFGPRWAPTAQQVEWIRELQGEELRAILRDGVQQVRYGQNYAALNGAEGAMGMARSGLQSRAYSYRPTGWGTVEPDGGQGLDDWAKFMQLHLGDPTEPGHAWVQTVAAMRPKAASVREYDAKAQQAVDDARANLDELYANGADAKQIAAAQKKADAAHARNEAKAKDRPVPVTGADWNEAFQAGRDSVRAYLDDPAMRHFLANAEMVRYLKDGTKVTDAASLARAKDELADRISDNMRQGLASRQGNGINGKLLDQLAVAHQIGIPDTSWLSHNVPVAERPEHTIGQLFAPYNQAHIPDRFPVGYTPMLTKAYGKVVTDQIDAISRNPLIAALYLNARQHSLPWQRFLVEEAGWDEASAAAVVQRQALRSAEQEAYKHIDNPHVASQFSLISRNFVNFERAQEDWLRRWGRAIADNPSIIRKAQLTLHGAEAAGMVEIDPTQPDQLLFVYPGSQLAAGMFNKAMTAVGLGNQVKIPVLGELTSQVQFLSPSLSQPFGLTVSPLLALPFKAIASTVGQDHQLLMNSLDKAMNGTLGSGRSWYEMILPPTINRIIRGVVQSDPGSQYGQAYTNATMALGATGAFDDPKLATDPTARSNMQDAIAAQVRNNMVLNALFGIAAPAVPGVEYAKNDGQTGTGTEADWSAHVLGYKSLKAEAQQALTELGPTRFRAWWAAVHPHELIWDPTSGVGSHTTAGAAGAYLPATVNSAVWMERNQAFLHKYGAAGVGAYFVPGSGEANQTFNDVAYRAQLEDHLREYKNLNQLLPDIITSRGESEYYAAKDGYTAAIDAATAQGNRYRATQLEAQWAAEKQEIFTRNPLLAQKMAGYAVDNTAGSPQQVALAQLRNMMTDTSPETLQAIGANRQGVQYLLQAYDDYTTADQALSGRRGTAATQARARLNDTYQAEIQSVAQQFPDLADMVRGVFRTP